MASALLEHVPDDRHRPVGVLLVDDERRRHAEDLLPGGQHQEAPIAAGVDDLSGGTVEVDADQEALAPDLLDRRNGRGQGAEPLASGAFPPGRRARGACPRASW